MPTALQKLLLINGPNMNLLGEREPDTYGRTTLAMLESQCRDTARSLELELDAFQSNAEHELIERIQAARADGTAAIILNPAAFTHTSVALRDALAAVALPFWEVHLSNVYRREPFRAHSYFSDLAVGVIAGFGVAGYLAAIKAAAEYLNH